MPRRRDFCCQFLFSLEAYFFECLISCVLSSCVLASLTLNMSASSLCLGFFTCSVVNLPSTTLRWFFDNDLFAVYPFSRTASYPLTVEPLNATYSSLVGGVGVQVMEASLNEDNTDMASFISTMTANISALQGAGVSAVSCGSIAIRNNFALANARRSKVISEIRLWY